LIDLRTLARRHNLPLDARGLAIPCGTGRIVAFDAGDLAFTTSDFGDADRALLQARVGRVVYRNAGAVTLVFPPGKLKDVLAIVGRAVREVA
jgi:hypothetical protein